MAQLIRSAKSASAWTKNDLEAFHIQVKRTQDFASFFGSDADLPEADVSPDILNHVDLPPETDTDKVTKTFYFHMKQAMEFDSWESTVNDFSGSLLSLSDYDADRDHHIVRQRGMKFWMCGERVDAISDVCVVKTVGSSELYTLLVQENKRVAHAETANKSTTAQLIAQAIAAFSCNNQELGCASRPCKEEQTFAGIVMIGTMPVFYKIPVTLMLASAVKNGIFPPQATIVQEFYHPDLDEGTMFSEGVIKLENRKIVLGCMKAFKSSLLAIP